MCAQHPSHDDPMAAFPPGSLAARLAEARAEQERLRVQAQQERPRAAVTQAKTEREEHRAASDAETAATAATAEAPGVADTAPAKKSARYTLTRLTAPLIRQRQSAEQAPDETGRRAGVKRDSSPRGKAAPSPDHARVSSTAGPPSAVGTGRVESLAGSTDAAAGSTDAAKVGSEAAEPAEGDERTSIEALHGDREQELLALLAKLVPTALAESAHRSGERLQTAPTSGPAKGRRKARRRTAVAASKRHAAEAPAPRAQLESAPVDSTASALAAPDGTDGAQAPSGAGGNMVVAGKEPEPPTFASRQADSGDADVAALRAQVQQARDELAAVRRRGERDKEEYTRFAQGEALKAVIPVLDDLDRALANVPAGLRGDPWVAGVMMIGESAQAMLCNAGVERIDPVGQHFDPHHHEAVARRVEGEISPGDELEHRVIQVYQPGYICQGRVLRPARVEVATRSRQRDGDDGANVFMRLMAESGG